MSRQRRERRTGSIYRRNLDGRWIAAVWVEGKRRTVSSSMFCKTLRRMEELSAVRATGRQVAKRAGRILAARTLGTHTAAEWVAYVKSKNGCCEYCGCMCNPTKDHRTPVSRGGSDGMDNLAVACLYCNQRKNDMTEAEWRAKVRPVRHTCGKKRRTTGPRITAEHRARARANLRRLRYGY